MTQPLEVVSTEKSVSSGVKNTGELADGLADILADTYRLTFKTHAYHWNVEGPLFFGIHNLTEAQYEDLFAAADVIAERIRALGHLAPAALKGIIDNSAVKDLDTKPSARDMVQDLADDHQRIALRLHALIKLAEGNDDAVTADLATARSAFHEKAAWMLRAIVAE